MKVVPTIRFAGFTDPWEQRKFIEIVDRVTITSTDSSLPQVEYEDINSGEGMLNKDLSTLVKFKTGIRFAPGDVLYGKLRPYLKNWLFPEFEGIAVGDFWVLRPLNCNGAFIYCLVQTVWFQSLADVSAGSKMPRADWSFISASEVRVPVRIKEQAKIGTFFQQLDTLITLHQRKFDQLAVLKKALLDKMFPRDGASVPEIRFAGFTDPWEQHKLGELGIVATNKRVYKNQTEERGEVPFFKIGTFGAKADAYISYELFEEYRAKYPYPQIGDLLISASGSIGRVIEYTGEDAYFQDSNIIWLDHNSSVKNTFLKQFYLKAHWGGLEGSTIKRLYNRNVLDTSIMLPDLDEQTKIGAFFQQLDTLIALHQRKLDALKKIKKSCLETMFV